MVRKLSDMIVMLPGITGSVLQEGMLRRAPNSGTTYAVRIGTAARAPNSRSYPRALTSD